MAVVVRDTFPDLGKKMGKKLTSKKAKEILSHGSVHGKNLSEKQKKFFGAIAGGQKPRRMHNPQEPYGNNSKKSGSTPVYLARGKMNNY